MRLGSFDMRLQYSKVQKGTGEFCSSGGEELVNP
jgi:hypothetical protein